MNEARQGITAKILSEVIDELNRQHDKFGDQTKNSDLMWLAILMEEVGEVSKEVVEAVFAGRKMKKKLMEKITSRVRKELVQVTAVCINWIICIDNRGNKNV